jgi:hypothetical protein
MYRKNRKGALPLNGKDQMIVRLSKFGKITGENLLQEFLQKYDLPNLAQATEEQLCEFWDYCTKP